MPEPKDTENLFAKLDQLEASESAKLVSFIKEVSQQIEALQVEVFDIWFTY